MQVPAAEIPNTPGSRMPNWMSGVSRQESSGIGILFDRVSLAGPFTIQVVIPGSAAALCGRIAAGDMLHGVGKTPVYELDQQQAVALLRGQAGSDITLWMSQAPTDGEPRPPVKEVKVKRNSNAKVYPRQPGPGFPSGIGILFDRVSLAGPFTIQVVIPGSAAALCGRIAAGDMLHGVGKTPVYELDQQQAVALLRGQAGSDITLWMSQAPTDGEPRPPVKEVKVKRNSVNHSYANAAECESRTSVESQRILPDWIHHLLVHSPLKL